MKWVERFRTPIPTRDGAPRWLVHEELAFTEEERERLAGCLRDFDGEAVGRFLSGLEFLCDGLFRRSQAPDRASTRDVIGKTRRDCERARRTLENVYRGRVCLAPYEHVHLVGPRSDPRTEAWGAAMTAAAEAERALRRFLAALEAIPAPQGDPREANATRFYSEVADFFEVALGRAPSEARDGPFLALLSVAFEALGTVGVRGPATDPTRGARRALKERRTRKAV